jgi:hypothetical protein
MSAEDELTSRFSEPPPIAGRDIAAYVAFWDDSESNEWNIRIIDWWLRLEADGPPSEPS